MTPELTLLAWTLVLALAQIFLTSSLRTQETGVGYNASARDAASPIPPRMITSRMQRAQNNLFEMLPLFIAAVLIVHGAKLESDKTYLGCMLYFWGRVVYVPLYALGIKYVRTLAWGVSFVGLIKLLEVILTAA